MIRENKSRVEPYVIKYTSINWNKSLHVIWRMNEYCNVININIFSETSIDVIQEEHTTVGYKPVRLWKCNYTFVGIFIKNSEPTICLPWALWRLFVFLAGMINLFNVKFSLPFFPSLRKRNGLISPCWLLICLCLCVCVCPHLNQLNAFHNI